MTDTDAFPDRSLREKLKAIRDSDHPAAPWARNIVQIMDTMEKDDPDALRALGHASMMLEWCMNKHGTIAKLGVYTTSLRHLTPDEIAAIFGLGGQPARHQ